MFHLRALTHVLLAGSLHSVVNATPTARNYSPDFDDTYDDLPGPVAVGIPQINNYHGLTYTNWAVGSANAVTGNDDGLIPHSGRQNAVNVAPVAATGTAPGYIAIGAGGKCFDLESFYFGCVLFTVGAVPDTAVACEISVSGYRGRTMVGERPFNFGNPANPLAAPMLLADLSTDPNYKCVTNVTISVASVGAVIFIDDLVHRNYK